MYNVSKKMYVGRSIKILVLEYFVVCGTFTVYSICITGRINKRTEEGTNCATFLILRIRNGPRYDYFVSIMYCVYLC